MDEGRAGRDAAVGQARQAQVMRRELGRQLQKLREAAGLSQQQLARRIGYARSAVSNAEAGGYARRRFWELSGQVLGSGDVLALGYDEIRQLSSTARARVAELDWDVADVPAMELLDESRDPGSAGRALAGYQKLGWPVREHEGRLALVTGTVIDALEVPRAAGLLAAGWWLYTGGASDEVRGLPALPRPDHALAAIAAADSMFFLARSDAGRPWNDSGAPSGALARAGGVPAVRWHCEGSQVPAPPSDTDAGRSASWAYLPLGQLRLSPAIGLLDLLAKAAATARNGGGLTFPGGVLVLPATGPPADTPARI